MWSKLSKWDKVLVIVVVLFGVTQLIADQQDRKMDAMEAEMAADGLQE